MFKWFYHKRVRTSVAIFGSLFNDIYVLRKNQSGATISQVKVPLSYAPKRNFLQRIEEMQNGEDAERLVAVKLPRMSFEITNMQFDPESQLPKNNYHIQGVGEDRQKFYTYTPYLLSFELNIYAKSQDDALQVVEQIIPYFNPQYTMTVKPFAGQYDSIKEDVPITLQSVSFSDNFEGSIGDRRTIVYTLTFEMKTRFYGPLENRGGLIREVNTDLHVIQNDSDQFVKTINIVPDPINVSPDSDYGFTITDVNSLIE